MQRCLKMLQSCCLLGAIGLIAVSGQNDRNYMICKPVPSIFNQQNEGESSALMGPSGPPGKQGPIGPPGPQGPDGLSERTDWSEIDRRIESMVQAHLNCSGTIYNGYCYRLPLIVASYNSGGNKQAAADLCNYQNGTLVDIESQEMYDVLYKYIQTTWNIYIDKPSNTVVEVWLGSTYQNEQVQSLNGGTTYVKWASRFPGSHGVNVGWTVATKPNVPISRTGMWNFEEFEGGVPLCRHAVM